MKEPKHPLIKALRAERQRQKIKQIDIAVALNMTERNFINWEKQDRTPNFLALLDWAEILGLEVELKPKVKDA